MILSFFSGGMGKGCALERPLPAICWQTRALIISQSREPIPRTVGKSCKLTAKTVNEVYKIVRASCLQVYDKIHAMRQETGNLLSFSYSDLVQLDLARESVTCYVTAPTFALELFQLCNVIRDYQLCHPPLSCFIFIILIVSRSAQKNLVRLN